MSLPRDRAFLGPFLFTETTKGEFATPLFLFGKKLYICSMTVILILILITLLSINHKLRNQGRS